MMPRPADPPPPESWYVEDPAPRALADWVLSFWEMRIPRLATDVRFRILPNACVDLVIYVSEPSVGEGTGALVGPPHRSYVVGSTLRSFIVRCAGWRHVVGASLRPAGALPLLGVPAAVIGEKVAFLHDIIGNKADEIEDRVVSGPTEGARQRLADVLDELRRRIAPPDTMAHQAVELVRRAWGQKRIDSLAGDLNVSARRLERHFLEHVGITPKLFSRLVRFDRAVRDLAARGQTPWSQFALAHGFSDQAHFINEFREFAGVTPLEFEAESRVTDEAATDGLRRSIFES
jgi:AraC-like DNA-binding protein